MSTEDLASLIEIHKTLTEHKEKLVQLELAFPDGPIAHRLAHEKMMREALEDDVFISQVKLDAAKKGLWVLVLVTAGLIIIGIQVKLKTFLGIQ